MIIFDSILTLNWISLKRKIALVISLVIVIFIVISIPISYLIWFRHLRPAPGPSYERGISRKTSNLQELYALAIAETSNYSHIFNVERFSTYNHNETWPYTWANFIDTQVIKYYDNRYENLKARTDFTRPEYIRFHYEANVHAWDQIHVVYVPAPEGASTSAGSIQILSQNDSVLLKPPQYAGLSSGMKLAYGNDSEHQVIAGEEIDFSLTKSYVVEMTLTYDEFYNGLAAFFVEVYQIVVVNQSLMPLLFCVESVGVIA